MTAAIKNLRIVIGGLNVGGAERHLLYTLSELKKRGWDIKIITLSKNCQMRPLFEENGIGVFPPNYNENFLSSFRPLQRCYKLLSASAHLYTEFREDPKRLTHFFLPEAYILGSILSYLARFKGKRVMSRRSLNYYQKKYPLLAQVEPILHKRNDLILANSQKIIEQLIEEGAPKAKVQLIYNGIPLQTAKESKSDARKELELDSQALVFTIVANLIPYKGHSDLVKALNIAQKDLPKDWVLLVVGRDDGIEAALKEEARAFKLEKHIRWLGSRSDIASILTASDISLLCSHEEGFSNAILEAMGMGVPVIATDVGGNAEAIIHEETGLIVPTKHPEKLAKAIVTLAQDAKKRKTFGHASKKRAEEAFSLERCADTYERCYLSLLAKEEKAK